MRNGREGKRKGWSSVRTLKTEKGYRQPKRVGKGEAQGRGKRREKENELLIRATKLKDLLSNDKSQGGNGADAKTGKKRKKNLLPLCLSLKSKKSSGGHVF